MAAGFASRKEAHALEFDLRYFAVDRSRFAYEHLLDATKERLIQKKHLFAVAKECLPAVGQKH